jgi:hypothetical protein
MRRLHYRAPIILSALMLLGAGALGAQATQAVTRSEMEAFVLAIVGTSGAVVFGAFWVLLQALVGRVERSLSSSVSRLEEAVERAATALATHDGSVYAHRAASEHNHKAIEDAIAELDAKMDTVIKDCDTHRCGYRDERQHAPKRESDPAGFDAEKLRKK